MDTPQAKSPKPCSAETLSASLQPTVALDDATAAAGTPIGDDYTPQLSTAGIADRQSISSVWESIMENIKTLDHPLPRNVTPATQDEVRAAETRMGYPMPLPLKEFYSLTNGIKIRGCLRGWDLYVPFDVQFCRIDHFSHDSSHNMRFSNRTNFETSMEMWNGLLNYTCMDNFSGGLLYKWDSSFDSQCGNVVVANSLVEHLQVWDDLLGNCIQSIVATRDLLLSALSSTKPQRFPRLSSNLAFKIALYVGPVEVDNYPNEWDLVDIDESVPHRVWFEKFQTEYERHFGDWPQYIF